MGKVLLSGILLTAAYFGQTNWFVMDEHVHMINRQFYLGGNISDSYKDGQVDLPRVRKGGVSAIFFSLFSEEAYYTNRYEVKHVLRLIDLSAPSDRKEPRPDRDRLYGIGFGADPQNWQDWGIPGPRRRL